MQVMRLDSSTPIVERLRQDPRGGRRPVPRPADQRHQLLPRRRRLRRAGAAVVPKLFEGRGADDTVRVWVPGCATGEEVLLDRHPAARAHGHAARPAAGADLRHRHRRARARRWRAPAAIPQPLLDGVSRERRERFFIEVSTRSDGRSDLVVGDQADAAARACSPICFSRAVGAPSRKVCIGVLPKQ